MKWAFALPVQLWLQVSLIAPHASAQLLNVYSEFARIDAQGNVLAPEVPREILSPALVRNGFTTFQVVVQGPPDTPYVLRVGQNPDRAAKVTLYRTADGHLERTAEPVTGKSTQIFWMDVWMEKTDPVRRIKVEPGLEVNGDWVIYPMEMRVRENIVPDAAFNSATPESAVPFEILRAYVCSGKLPPPPPSEVTTPDALHVRNARQDVAMAAQLSTQAREELRKWIGGCNARASSDPEAYLHVRDYFFTPLWMKIAHGN